MVGWSLDGCTLHYHRFQFQISNAKWHQQLERIQPGMECPAVAAACSTYAKSRMSLTEGEPPAGQQIGPPFGGSIWR